VLLTTTYTCPVCGQVNETAVDPSQGASQTYVEDCQVCCRPLVLSVTVDAGVAGIEAVPESE
jgi:hypothetical protein